MKYYLFDFDGTLVDSMPTFGQTIRDIMDDAGVPYGDDLIKIVTPLGYGGCADYCISIGLEGPTERVVGEMKDRMMEKYKTSIPAKSDVPEVLKKLKALGHSLNLLTASPHSIFEPCLERLRLLNLFDNLWSCDDFGTTKDNPEIYRMAAASLGTNVENLIFLDDNLGACATAKSAGAHVIGVFDESSKDYVCEMQKASDEYVYSFLDIPTV